jgi:hypothetical protein
VNFSPPAYRSSTVLGLMTSPESVLGFRVLDAVLLVIVLSALTCD